jgi:hypothetical protein
MIVPFQIPSDPKGLAELNRQLSATRWNDAVVSDWSYGMERKFLQQLIRAPMCADAPTTGSSSNISTAR